MVLNDKSDHPNPFRPPMPYNTWLMYYYPERLYKGWPDAITDVEPIKPRYNIMTDSTFNWRLYLAAQYGTVIGEGGS